MMSESPPSSASFHLVDRVAALARAVAPDHQRVEHVAADEVAPASTLPQ
jgi:hypothetical protein